MFLRLTGGALKTSWWLTIILLAIVVVYLLLGRVFVYVVASNKDRLEQVVQNAGLQQLELGAVEGDWFIFDPVFEVTDVRLKAEDEVLFAIDSLRVRLDSWRSFAVRTPIVSELQLSGIRLTVDRDDEGFLVRGLPRGGGTLDLNPVLDSLPHVRQITLADVDITLAGIHEPLHLSSRPDEPWVISAEEGKNQISFPLYLERRLVDGGAVQTQLELVGSYQGDMRSSEFRTSLYLRAPQLALGNLLPVNESAEKRLTGALLDAEVWLEMSPGSVDAWGTLDVMDIEIGHQGLTQSLAARLSTAFRFRGQSFLEGSMFIPSLSLKDESYTFEFKDLSLAVTDSDTGIRMAALLPALDVAETVGLIRFAGEKALVPARLSRALEAVSPRGALQDVALVLGLDDLRPKLVGNLVDISMDAYLGVPAFSSLNGFIDLQLDQGYLDIDNDAFEMYFSNMFSAPWPFDSGRGRLAYRADSGQFKVTSGLIELIHGDLAGYGKVSLNLPRERELQTWGLTVGITGADLTDADRFLPNTIPDDLHGWLTTAIERGQGQESGLTFHGALFRGAPGIRKSHDLYFKVDDAQLRYHDAWPVVSQMKGTVHANSYFVRSAGVTGALYESAIVDADVDVPISRDNKADTVLVTARAEGPLGDVIRALNQTPLSETTGGMAAQWQALGAMEATLALNVPVGDRKTEEVGVDVGVSFDQASLVMPDFNLTMQDMAGSARYTSADGLSADAFQGRLFGEVVTVAIKTEALGEGGEITVNFNGRVSADNLYHWSDQVLLSRAEGSLDYEATVHVPFGSEHDQVYVIATSDLVGVTLDVPAPLAKPEAGDARDFVYSQFFAPDSYRVDMSLDDNMHASLKIVDGIAVGGRMHFGETTFGAVAYDQIRLTGSLDYLDYEAWMEVTEALSELTDVSLEDEIAEHVESAELEIAELMLFSLPLEQAQVRVTRNESAWVAEVSNDMLAGVARVSDSDDVPMQIDLERLRFAEDENSGDPLGDVDPIAVGAIDFSTSLLEIDDENYGSWSFRYRPGEAGARFEALTADGAGMKVLPNSTLDWAVAAGQHRSHFTGDVEITDLATALRQFGFAASMEGEDIQLQADIVWEGSPAMVDVMSVSGPVTVEEGKGRFVQAETGGALKLLGVFDFASLARRFRLDFSDVVEEGFEFNNVTGTTRFDTGKLSVTEPFRFEGSSGRFTVGGRVDLDSGELENEMIVTLPLRLTLPWYAAYSAIATGPLAGAGVMLAQKVFENQIDQMSSAKYRIGGTIDEPVIEFVAIFDDKVAGVATEESEQP